MVIAAEVLTLSNVIDRARDLPNGDELPEMTIPLCQIRQRENPNDWIINDYTKDQFISAKTANTSYETMGQALADALDAWRAAD